MSFVVVSHLYSQHQISLYLLGSLVYVTDRLTQCQYAVILCSLCLEQVKSTGSSNADCDKISLSQFLGVFEVSQHS